MATRDKFFAPLAAGANLHATYCGAVLSRLTYTQDASLLGMWAGAMGFTGWELIQTPGRVIPNFMIARRYPQLVIAIPGTENLVQMMNNVIYSAQTEDASFGTGRVHSFFAWCARGIIPFIDSYLSQYTAPQQVCLIGHSLGGAVAQLLADYIALHTSHQVKLVQTFNTPRIGAPDWARRDRSYASHLAYNTHDMVCELPPNVIPSTSALQTQWGFLDAYEHRDDLYPIPSRRNINESWFAIGVSKVVYPVEWAIGAASSSATAARVMHALGFVGSRCALASWVLPLPAWYLEHSMETVLDNLEQIRDFTPMTEWPALVNLRAAIQAHGQYPNNPYISTSAIVNPHVFANGQTPPSLDPDGIPPPLPAEKFELIEAAFKWDATPQEGPSFGMISVEQSFIEALTASAATVPGGNPLLSPTPIAVELPARPHWVFRGRDRRILTKMWELLDAIERRDAISDEAGWTSAISTRETMFPLDDDDLQPAFTTIKGQVGYLLTLAYEE